jgi:hypothetical protein
LDRSIMRRRRHMLIVVALLALSLAAFYLTHVEHKSTFELLATHPDAAAQPTATGRVIATLAAFNGELYAGYGDYGENTGPITIRGFDVATGRFGDPLLRSQTEAIYLFRMIDRRLYAPHIDPSGDAVMGGFACAILDDSGHVVWTDHVPVVAAHVFDVNTLTGSDLWLAGSERADAVVWRSLDGGATWSEALRERPSFAQTTRYCGIGVLNGKLYVQKSEPARTSSRVFDGNSWSDGPNLLPPSGFLWHPQRFAGRIVYMSNHSGIRVSPLYCFDGTQMREALNPIARGQRGPGAEKGVYDFTIADNRLFTLGVDQVVRWTDDVQSWHKAADAPAEARSLCVVGDKVYLGGKDGAIYKSQAR